MRVRWNEWLGLQTHHIVNDENHQRTNYGNTDCIHEFELARKHGHYEHGHGAGVDSTASTQSQALNALLFLYRMSSSWKSGI